MKFGKLTIVYTFTLLILSQIAWAGREIEESKYDNGECPQSPHSTVSIRTPESPQECSCEEAAANKELISRLFPSHKAFLERGEEDIIKGLVIQDKSSYRRNNTGPAPLGASLPEALKALPPLEALVFEFTYGGAPEDMTKAISDSTVYLGDLKELVIVSRTILPIPHARHLSAALAHMTQLQHLILEGKIAKEDISVVAENLPPQLQRLEIVGNILGPAGTEAVFKALSNMPKLEELTMIAAGLSFSASPPLGTLRNLRSLTVALNFLDEPLCKLFLRQLWSFHQLETLCLSQLNINDNCSFELKNLISRLQKLKELDISGNHLTPEAEKRIIKFFEAMKVSRKAS